MPQPQKAVTDISNSLERALDWNEAIQESVEQSAEELCVLNAVLSQEVPDHLIIGEVAQAILRTEELENRIQAAADDLAEVNQALKDEISVRADLERQLAAAQAELCLAQPQHQPVAYSSSQSRSGSGPVPL